MKIQKSKMCSGEKLNQVSLQHSATFSEGWLNKYVQSRSFFRLIGAFPQMYIEH